VVLRFVALQEAPFVLFLLSGTSPLTQDVNRLKNESRVLRRNGKEQNAARSAKKLCVLELALRGRGARKKNVARNVSIWVHSLMSVSKPITLNLRPVASITTQADFTYSIRANTISITDTREGKGSRSVTNDMEADA
jgi:hypothetical protein